MILKMFSHLLVDKYLGLFPKYMELAWRSGSVKPNGLVTTRRPGLRFPVGTV